MSNCSGSCGSCGSSGGCTACETCGHANELLLTEEEIEFLRLLGQVAFLPVARKMGDLDPVYLEEGEAEKDRLGLLLQFLEKKGVVSLDYSQPLHGFDYSAYVGYPIRGSMALTERGQKVLELLDLQGYDLE